MMEYLLSVEVKTHVVSSLSNKAILKVVLQATHPLCNASSPGSHFSCFCINFILVLPNAVRQWIHLTPLILIHPHNYISISHMCLPKEGKNLPITQMQVLHW